MNKTKDIPFSNLDRGQRIRQILDKDIYDLVIIGGGITGAGIALDAALRGIKTLLIEKSDFAAGTSSKSTKLIHGGLRYLKQFEFGLVRESGLERSVLHHNIPHLVHPERMLLPIVEDGGFDMFTASIAVSVYDMLAKVSRKDRKIKLNKSRALEAEPLLPESRLKGAISYAEYRTDDARLTIELIKAARRHGAEALNYMALDRIENDEAEGMRLHCSDKLDGTSYVFDARAVVSAAGPWVDKVRGISEQSISKKLHLTKGVHVVVHKKELPVRSPIYFDTKDGRMIFVIPRDKVCYIGTTDTDYHGDLDNVLCTKEDALYLLDNVNSYFEGISISLANVISSWAGLRPLIQEEGKGPTELS
ncbi:MAG: glycerol-3-phosphate dehydrogenase/oxidase, partial [Bacteroidia bacterium]|nr:glycerol-3-phosphate dehydrogenase/oxidase [Bacteroidia bacterium]